MRHFPLPQFPTICYIRRHYKTAYSQLAPQSETWNSAANLNLNELLWTKWTKAWTARRNWKRAAAKINDELLFPPPPPQLSRCISNRNLYGPLLERATQRSEEHSKRLSLSSLEERRLFAYLSCAINRNEYHFDEQHVFYFSPEKRSQC